MRATLQVIDMLQDQDVPLDAVGIQAHLLADQFKERFDSRATGASCASSPTAA